MADEAHGAQFYFSNELPISAMAAGCDLRLYQFIKPQAP